MKNIVVILSVILMFISCEPNREKAVEYEVDGSVSQYKLQYIDKSGNLIKTVINPESATDIWRYGFTAEEGDIVYVSGKYDNINSALRISIKVDGKIYKEEYSFGDTVKYLTVSGVIPYE